MYPPYKRILVPTSVVVKYEEVVPISPDCPNPAPLPWLRSWYETFARLDTTSVVPKLPEGVR